jgi:hypothetical protein
MHKNIMITTGRGVINGKFNDVIITITAVLYNAGHGHFVPEQGWLLLRFHLTPRGYYFPGTCAQQSKCSNKIVFQVWKVAITDM